MAEGHRRPAWVEIDQQAMRSNASAMTELAGDAMLCAVVKADGYGHGAVASAKSFLSGGASWLAVALVEEGIELRRAGIDAPILLLSEPASSGMEEAVVHRLTPTLYTNEGLAGLERAAKLLGDGRTKVNVHLKVDTGMHRVGASPDLLGGLAEQIASSPALALGGLWTHLAIADVPQDPYTGRQLELFDQVRRNLGDSASGAIIHAANSAATISNPDSRYSMVRCGLSLYGYSPIKSRREQVGESARPALIPALSLKAQVSYVREIASGERVSYGLAYQADQPTVIATVPLGYADGVPRRAGTSGGEVLIGGRRSKIAGNVTMDQMLVDCGPNAKVLPGDEVVLIGRQGTESITADNWANWLGVIVYEVLCGIGPRVPRISIHG